MLQYKTTKKGELLMIIKPNIPTGGTSFPDPHGIKIEKTPLENVFITYLGNKDNIQEITLCQKKVNENGKTYYLELITKNKYTKIPNNEIYVLKTATLFSILNLSSQNEIKSILKKGYLTNESILTLYEALNQDQEYETKYYSRGDGPVYHDCPSFLQRYKNSQCIYDKEDENLSNLVLELSTDNKIQVLNGELGIGKTTTINKLNHFIRNQKSLLSKKEIWKIDFNEFIKGIITTKHLEERIKKVFKFLNKQPDSILFIDDIDFENKQFIKILLENYDSNKVKLVLIPKEKINDKDLSKDRFNIINMTSPSEKTQREILKQKIKELENETNIKINLNTEEKQELISILINSNKSNSLNDNYDKNPLLAIRLLINAFQVAFAYYQSEVYLHNFYYAMNIGDIKVPKDARDKFINSINDLSNKVAKRNLKEHKEKAKTKTISYRLKNIFKNK